VVEDGDRGIGDSDGDSESDRESGHDRRGQTCSQIVCSSQGAAGAGDAADDTQRAAAELLRPSPRRDRSPPPLQAPRARPPLPWAPTAGAATADAMSPRVQATLASAAAAAAASEAAAAAAQRPPLKTPCDPAAAGAPCAAGSAAAAPGPAHAKPPAEEPVNGGAGGGEAPGSGDGGQNGGALSSEYQQLSLFADDEASGRRLPGAQ
jgi:hypothetical protein